jgi:hypothetical protein
MTVSRVAQALGIGEWGILGGARLPNDLAILAAVPIKLLSPMPNPASRAEPPAADVPLTR